MRSILTTLAAALVVLFAAAPVAAQTGPKGFDLMQALRPGLLLSTVVYAVLGMVFFGISFAIFNKLMPFSVRKEIEEDQNTALGIIIGAFLIGLAIIIASAIH